LTLEILIKVKIKYTDIYAPPLNNLRLLFYSLTQISLSKYYLECVVLLPEFKQYIV